jgi:flagellar biosynthesis protein
MSKELNASALKYDQDESAPKIIAKGKGYIAEKIIETAKENSITIYKDEKLSKQLENLNLGQEIPNELYQVVAEILIYISKFDK